MAADNALDHAFVTVVVAAGTVAVALTCCEEQGQILRMTGLQKTLLKSLGQGLRACAGYETAGSDGVAVLNLESGLLCGDNAYFLHVDLLLNVNAILAGAGEGKPPAANVSAVYPAECDAAARISSIALCISSLDVMTTRRSASISS